MASQEAPPLQIVAVKSYAGPKRGESVPAGLVPPVGPLCFKRKQVMTLIDWNEEHDYILGCYRADMGKQRRGWFPASYICVVKDDDTEEDVALTSPRYVDVGGGAVVEESDLVLMRRAPSSDSSDSDGRSSSGELGGVLQRTSSDREGRAAEAAAKFRTAPLDKAQQLNASRWKSAGNLLQKPLEMVESESSGSAVQTTASEGGDELTPRSLKAKKIESAVSVWLGDDDASARLSSAAASSASQQSIPALKLPRKKSDAAPGSARKGSRAQTLEDLLKVTRSSSSVSGPDSHSIPLNAVQPVDKRGIPVLVTSIIKHLRSNGMTEENLFRASGHGQEVRELKRLFMNGKPVDLSKTRNIHSCAAVLKLFLRELSEPLLTYDLHESFTASLALPTEERRLEHFKYLLELLPPQNYNITACLAGFLYETVQLANENSLTLVQASRIFGQSFCRQSTYTIDREELEKSYLVTQHLIALHAKLFTDYLDVFDTELDRKRLTRRKKEKEMMDSYLKREQKEKRKQEKKERKERKKKHRKKSDEPTSSAPKSTPTSPVQRRRPSQLAGAVATPSPNLLRPSESPFDINSPKVGRHSPAMSESPGLRRRRRISARNLMDSRDKLVHVEQVFAGEPAPAPRTAPSIAALQLESADARTFTDTGTPVVLSSDEEEVRHVSPGVNESRGDVPRSEWLSSASPPVSSTILALSESTNGCVWGMSVTQWHRAFLALLLLSVLSHLVRFLL